MTSVEQRPGAGAAVPQRPISWRATRRGPQRPRWPLPDFLPTPRRPPAWSWGLLAAGLGAVLLVGVLAWQARAAGRQASLQRAHWHALLQAGRDAAAPPVADRGDHTALPASGAVAHPANLANAARLAGLLAHPWHRVLDAAAQPLVPGLRWLRLAHDVAQGDVVLEGQVPDRESALRVKDALEAAPGWHAVQLVRVVPDDDGPGWRIELRARALADAPPPAVALTAALPAAASPAQGRP